MFEHQSREKQEQFECKADLNMSNICKSKMGRDQMSDGLSTLFHHDLPVSNARWKSLEFSKRPSPVIW